MYVERAPHCPTPVKQEVESRASSTEPRERGERAARGALLHTADPREDDADPDIIPSLYGELLCYSDSPIELNVYLLI